MTNADQGHRTLPHTADLIIEAWGPTRTACFEEAAAGLVQSFTDISGAVGAAEPVPFALDRSADDELLVQLLEEILYLVDALSVVPASTEVIETEDGGIAGAFDVVPVGTVEETGAVPKAISRGDLAFAPEADGSWLCRFTVDV